MAPLRRSGPALLIVLAVAAFLVAHPSATTAAPTTPERWSEPVDVSFPVSDVCAFTYTQTIVGMVKGTTFFDREGTPIREVVHVRFDGTFSANGITVPFIVNETDHVTLHADGSVTVVSTGITGRAVVPGQGLVGATIGRLTFSFGPTGEPTGFEFLAGQNNEEEFFGGILCDLLTPAA